MSCVREKGIDKGMNLVVIGQWGVEGEKEQNRTGQDRTGQATGGEEGEGGRERGKEGQERKGREGDEIMLTRRALGLHDRTASTMSSKSLYITLSHPRTAAT